MLKYLYVKYLYGKKRMRFGYFILIIDLLWILAWFGISMWYICDTNLNPSYYNDIRDLLFHHINTAGVVYILTHKSESLTWLACIPFLVVLLSDINNLVTTCVRLDRVQMDAWISFLILTIVALVASVCGLIFFLISKIHKRGRNF
jgi:hypothetical protein